MSKVFRVLIAIALLLGLSAGISAQPDAELSVALIDKRIDRLKAGGAADGDPALQAYLQAKTLLNQVADFDRDEADYTAALTSAPREQAEIQARIDRFDSTYDPASDLADFTPQEITSRLALARAEQSDLNSQINRLDGSLSAQETVAANVRSRLREIDEQASKLPSTQPDVNPAAEPSLTEANRWRAAAESLTLSAERRAKEAQLASQPARYSALAAQRAELGLKLERLSLLIRELEQRDATSVAPAMNLSELDISAEDPAYTVAAALIEDDAELREQQIKVSRRLAEARQNNDEVARTARTLEDRYATARRIADFAGDSDTQGQALLTYWRDIDDFVLSPARQLSQEAGSAVIRRIGHEEALSRLVSAGGFVNQRVLEAGMDPDAIPQATQSALLHLTQGYRQRLRSVIAGESAYIDTLSELQSAYATLTDTVRQYRAFLEGRILWIPNHPPLWKIDPLSIGDSMSASTRYVAANLEALKISPGPALISALLIALLLLLYRRRLVALQKDLAGRTLRPRDDSVRLTLRALGAAALRAAPIPVTFIGLATSFDSTTSQASDSMTQLFFSLALLVFFVDLMRIVSEPSGIGAVHFSWRTATMQRLHRQLTFMTRWWIPIAAVASVANRLAPTTGDEAAARSLILLGLAILIYRLSKPIVRELRLAGGTWFRDTLNQLRLLLTAALLVLVIQTAYGQVYTVTVVAQCMIGTVWIGVSLLLIHALLLRWLRVAQRHLRLSELLAKRPAAVTSEDGVSAEEQVPDLGDVSAETRQLVTASTMAAAATALLYTWSPLLPAFDALSQVVLWTSTSEIDGESLTHQITLATLVIVTALAGLTLFAAKKLPAVIEIILRSRTRVSPGTRYTVSTLLNYLIIGAGVIAALSALGLQWGQLQWLVAALGVGIGFGLQEIVANFISGLIILFERPVRVGDIVTVGDKDGTVTKIRIRATTIRDWDGKELLVPNKEFITGRLLNWTLSDANTRVIVNVGIAYGSNVEQALEILRDVAQNHPRTLSEPAPLIVFENFGDNAIELSARSFIDTLDGRLQVMTEMRQEINRRFEEAGIVIAFPQRDVHLDAPGPIRIALDPPPDSPAAR